MGAANGDGALALLGGPERAVALRIVNQIHVYNLEGDGSYANLYI